MALLLALLTVRIWDPYPLETLRLKTFDLFQILRPRVPPDRLPVAIVDIDEPSLREYGQWPWPRTLIAELVRRIVSAHVVAIGFDAIFPEQDRTSPDQMAQLLGPEYADIKERLITLPKNEDALAAAMRGQHVVLGVAGHHRSIESGPSAPLPSLAIATIGGDPRPALASYPGLLRNRPELEREADGFGLLTIRPDRDGLIRRVPSLSIADGVLLPTLSLELIRVATGSPTLLVKRDAAGIRSIVIAGREIATDSEGQLWPQLSPHHPPRFVSARDVLSANAPSERLTGKLVVIGSSASGLFDLRSTPLDRVTPGVEIHTQLIESMLSGALLYRPHHAIGIELFTTAAAALVVIVLVPLLGAMPTLLVGAVFAIALLTTSWFLFVGSGTLLDVSFPLLSTLLVFALLAFANYYHEETRRAQIRAAFSQYVSPDLVKQLTREPDRLVLGGETRTMTVLFSDVRGFTAISELYRGDPQGLVTLMNGLLTPLTNAILERRGTIDKYMGDAILAFWNAPLDDADHACNGAKAALDMLEQLARFNADRNRRAQADGTPFIPINIGVGINTGHCVVGNFGSDLRFDYSILGDSVNLASRLEALSKTYGLSIILGSETARRVESQLAVVPIDYIRVKGKSEPEEIYALLGGNSDLTSAWFRVLVENIIALRGAYASASWDEAREHLASCRAHDAENRLQGVLALYESRIASLAERNVTADQWDGVYTFATKEG